MGEFVRDVNRVMVSNNNFMSHLGRNCDSFECAVPGQLRKFNTDLQNFVKFFTAIEKKFLTAIDHVEDADEESREERRKRSLDPSQQVHRWQYDDLTYEEQQWVEDLLIKIRKIDPKLHDVLQREKRFGFISWLLGWGVWSNSRNIKAIKNNIRVLHLQNILQEKQIHELAGYLNLTANVVQEHTQALYEIDQRLIKVEYTMQQLKNLIKYTRYYAYFMNNIQFTMMKVGTGLNMLQTHVEKVYEYLRVLAVHKINPLILPPENFRDTLGKVKEQMRSNPRLELPHNPETDIWAYYSIVRVTPVVLEDLLIIVLTIPLIDKSLKMDLYKVHNLPALHPEYKLQAQYELEGEYFAVGQHGLYVALPTASDVQLCMSSGGGLCVMNQALYPIDRVEWCIYALYIQDPDKIQENCLVQTRKRFGNLAYSLGGYMWAISSLVGDKIQIRCVQDTHVQDIKPPLQLIQVGNGCEGYSSSIYIPAKSELTDSEQMEERTNFFFGFNVNYTKIEAYGAWTHLQIQELSEEQKSELAIKLSELPPMTFTHLNKKLQELDYKYPWTVSSKVVLFLLIACAIFWLLVFVICLWRMYKMRTGYKTMKPFTRVIRGRPEEGDFMQMREVISGILSTRPTGTRRIEEISPRISTISTPPNRALPSIIELGSHHGASPISSRERVSHGSTSGASVRATDTTFSGSSGQSSSMAGILCDLLQEERQQRRFGKFLERKQNRENEPKARSNIQK